MKKRPLLDRLAEKIDFQTDGCWAWTACRHPEGYGLVSAHGKCARAHRALYAAVVGDLSNSMVLDHVICGNKWCVNPDHLEVVTPRENTKRSKAQITHCPYGHELEAGARQRWCRSCSYRRRDAYRARKRAVVQ